MPKLKNIVLLLLLFACQNNNANPDKLIKVSRYIQSEIHAFSGSFWSFRIKEYKDIYLRFFLSDDINKEQKFIILQQAKNYHRKEIGYGIYTIKDGIINSFKVKECKHEVASILKDQKLKLYYTDQDLENDFYLLFDKSKIKLWGYFLRYPGVERVVDGIPVIIVNYNGFTKEGAEIRTSPSLGNNKVKYIDKDKNELDSVPEDTFVFVYARTKNKYKVGELYNYWYLIRGINVSEPAVETFLFKYVWVFADFVEYESSPNEDGTWSPPTGFPYD